MTTKPGTLESRVKTFRRSNMSGTESLRSAFTFVRAEQLMADFHRSETERLVREIRASADEYDEWNQHTGNALRELAERIERSCK